MSPLLRLLVFLAFGGAVCACASLSGLDQYSPGSNANGSSDGTVPSHPPDASVDLRGETSSRDVDVWAREDGGIISDDRGGDSSDVGVGADDASLNADSAGWSAAGNHCVGGQSTATCGTGGVTCVNCGSQSCNSGACSTIASDAGRCTQTSCTVFTTLCIPVYESPCCKSDGTCSCNINFPPRPFL